MAIAVESVGTAEWILGSTASFTATFDAPTGVTVGDLLIGAFGTDGGSDAITTLTSTGWTAFGPGQAAAETARLFLLYKIADSSDAAATDFTFTTNYTGTGGGKVGGAILRVSGYAPTSTPVLITDDDSNRNGTGASFTSFSTTFTPAATDSLLIFFIGGANNEAGSSTFTGYTVSGTNPSWTERFDIFDADGDDMNLALATAIDTTTTNRTTASATCSASQDDYMLILGSFQAAVDVTVSADQLTLTANIQAPTVSADSNVSVGVQSLTFSLPAPTVTTQTVDWTYEARPAESVWTIEEQ